MEVISAGVTAMTLGDVGRNGDCGAAKLRGEPEERVLRE
jgi:hypothetical protein